MRPIFKWLILSEAATDCPHQRCMLDGKMCYVRRNACGASQCDSRDTSNLIMNPYRHMEFNMRPCSHTHDLKSSRISFYFPDFLFFHLDWLYQCNLVNWRLNDHNKTKSWSKLVEGALIFGVSEERKTLELAKFTMSRPAILSFGQKSTYIWLYWIFKYLNIDL